MLVSVIMATYKRPAYLKGALESVLRQSYENLEAVVVDDGSDDETQDVVASFNDPRVQYVNPGHQGVLGRVLNIGIKHAKGELIGFCDDDDAWLPNKLEKQVAYFKENPACGIVFTNVYYFDGQGARILDDHGNPKTGFETLNPPTADHFEELLVRNYMYKPSVVARRACIEEAGGFGDHKHHLDDYDLWVRIGKNHPIHGIAEPLALYRMHDGNMSSEIKQILATLEQYDINEPLARKPETRRRIRENRADLMYRLAKIHYIKNDLDNSAKWYAKYIRYSGDYNKIPPVIYKLLSGRIRNALKKGSEPG